MPGGRDARGRELVVKPGRGPAAEIGADGVVNRRQHLQEHEHDADQLPAASVSAATTLDRSDQPTHGDRENRRQQPAQDRSSTHQATASPRSARGSTPANFHSLRERKLLITVVLPRRLDTGNKTSCTPSLRFAIRVKNFARLSEL